MNGAEVLLRTLVEEGVDVCFANPGTSEMQFVAALDRVPAMRGVLALFEGVATGAADGYGRMTGSPAATLLHLGPGMANGIANLHNARRARTPLVNLVGDHATYHQVYDAPLQSDIRSLATPVSGYYSSVPRVEDMAWLAREAVAAALGPPGRVATLVVPADLTWTEVPGSVPPIGPQARAGSGEHRAVGRRKPPPGIAPARSRVEDARVEEIAGILAAASRVPGGSGGSGGAASAGEVTILIGGGALRERGLSASALVAARSGARLYCETFPARIERGGGLPEVQRLAYLAELAGAQLDGTRHLVLVDAKAPVSFFAYPGKPSSLVPDGCVLHELAGGGDDSEDALERLADALEGLGCRSAAGIGAGGIGAGGIGAGGAGVRRPTAARPEPPSGPLSASLLAAAIGAVLPEGAIVSDEGNTAGLFVAGATADGPPHDWLCLTGGAIGQGLPLATGAAVACPDRPVLCLEADGSAMYSTQALWTQAREGLNVTTVVLANRSYAVLEMELDRVGAGARGPLAASMLDIANPELNFVRLAEGMGVEACRVSDAKDLTLALERAFAEPGPHLVEAVLPRGLS